eukprot:gb/GECG01002263.1/.p1 GENE.gb/GECG01002263.1/~~gb/GECG01002263.1/.p1  ORF type:complete len:205 (+),score=27.05 gb/GECG01002263.1/:1-615(+)
MPEIEKTKAPAGGHAEANQKDGAEATPVSASQDVNLLLTPSEFFPTDHHLLHQALSGSEKLERYDIVWFPEHKVVQARVLFGQNLSGHPGIVHGGAIASVFDDVFGVLFFALRMGTGFTANLNVNYKLPIPAGRDVLYQVELQKVEGRKVQLKAFIYDADNTSRKLADATALFIMKNVPSSGDAIHRMESHLADLETEAYRRHW